jgi:hypothetical protein
MSLARGKILNQEVVHKNRDKYLKMDLQEKRKYYKYKFFTVVDGLLTWPEYYSKNKLKIFKQGKSSFF